MCPMAAAHRSREVWQQGGKMTLNITVKNRWNNNTWHTHHVEIGADFDSSGQVPHYAIPIMSCREKDSGIKGVGLQNKHFILVTLYKKKKYAYTLKEWDDSQRKKWDIVLKVQYSSSSYICFGFSHCCGMLNLNVVKYHEDMDEAASGGIPHFQRQIVCCCYHCAVVAIPCYHGNLQLCYFVF